MAGVFVELQVQWHWLGFRNSLTKTSTYLQIVEGWSGIAEKLHGFPPHAFAEEAPIKEPSASSSASQYSRTSASSCSRVWVNGIIASWELTRQIPLVLLGQRPRRQQTILSDIVVVPRTPVYCCDENKERRVVALLVCWDRAPASSSRYWAQEMNEHHENNQHNMLLLLEEG